MVRYSLFSTSLLFVAFVIVPGIVARPDVRSIRSAHEFDRVLQKHGSETGLPVVVDFYSDSCGPCRMMAPIFKKVAKEYKEKAVFVKVDTNAQYELSGRYGIRSLPTFQWFVGGKKVDEAKGGIGEGPLRQMTDRAIRTAELDNVMVTLEDLIQFYKTVDASKSESEIQKVYQKCLGTGRSKTSKCQGATASTLVRKLKKKYNQAPKTNKLFTGETKDSSDDTESSSSQGKDREKTTRSSSSSSRTKSSTSSQAPNLHLATKEQLQEELEKRLDEERDAQLEEESDEDEEAMDEHYKYWNGPGDFPERVTIIGGGPAGLAAAVYAARAGLEPLVLAPSMGGQLQGKGVDVENYPGLSNVTGPAVIAAMRHQAAHYGAVFEEDWVVGIDASSRPLKVITNSTGAIETHAIIVATGADSKWLGIEGEYEMRGGGVSSCATCDGFLFAGKHVVVVGGGDAAMEDALVLARTSQKVTLIHRRDEFRASKVLANRVKEHPSIHILWNTVVEKIEGKALEGTDDNNQSSSTASAAASAPSDDEDEVDLDQVVVVEEEDPSSSSVKVVAGVVLRDTVTNEIHTLECDAVFVAIGHIPNTGFLQGVVEFDPDHPGYIQTYNRSTKTSVPGIFAAGDVSDAVYRQAITSAGSGAAAALDAERWLSEEGLGNEAAELEAELMAELMNEQQQPRMGEDDLGGAGGYNAYEDAGGRMQGMRESLNAEL